MIDNSDQMIRFWIDNVLQLTKDGLKKPILNAYKNRFPNNYMAEIQEKLGKSNATQYASDIFTSDDLLLSKLEDPRAWLELMARRWNDLFQPKSGTTGKRHVENLKEIRDKWAHNRSLTFQDAYTAAQTSINLLTDFKCDPSTIESVRQIFVELDQLKNTSREQVRVSAAPPPPPVASSNGTSWIADDSSDGDTEVFHVKPGQGGFCIEVIEHDGATRHTDVPLEFGRVIVGRSANAHIGLQDSRVSRVHILLAHSETGLTLTDLLSANGTQLDGKRLTPNHPTPWCPGQVVTVGQTWLILRRAHLH